MTPSLRHPCAKLRYLLGLGWLLCSLALSASPLEQGIAAFQDGDYQQAFEHWKPLAEANDAKAQYNIGLLYLHGLGVERNAEFARILFLAAARQDMVEAQYNLGLLLYDGLGVFRNSREARRWWSLAAQQGHAPSRYNLGHIYIRGIGAERDVDRGLALWEAAADQGHPEAIETLARIYASGEIDGRRDPQRAEYWQQRLAP